MHTLDIDYGSDHLSLTFPGGWKEVTSTDLPKIALLLGSVEDDGTSRILMLQALSGMPDVVLTHEKLGEELMIPIPRNPKKIDPNYKPYRLLPQLDWVYEPPLYHKSLMPLIEHNGTRYRGPDDGLEKWTINQWSFAFMLLRAYQAAKEPADRLKAMNDFLGACYQPEPATTGYALFPFDAGPIEEYAEALSTLPPATKVSAMLNYQALHREITTLFPGVFNPYAEGSSSPMGVFGTLYDVAQTGVFGDIEKTEHSSLHKVMGMLEHNLHKQEEERKEMEKARRAQAPMH